MIACLDEHIIPSECLLCGSSDKVTSGVCHACRESIRPLPLPGCAICSAPIASGGVCLACQHQPPPFDRLISAACYEGRLREIIQAFKYHRVTVLKHFLGETIAGALQGEDLSIDVVTCVPLHWRRLIQRGYNQSGLLARELARQTGLRLDLRILSKRRHTGVQAGLNRTRRASNLRGAFRAGNMRDTSVLVVDDVVTTGQTAREIALTLKRAGAAQVSFISAGRVVQ